MGEPANDSELPGEPEPESGVPGDDSQAEFYPLEPQISDEELRDRYRNPGRLYTTEEVLAHLRSLDKPKE
jgi:hypothetical protein